MARTRLTARKSAIPQYRYNQDHYYQPEVEEEEPQEVEMEPEFAQEEAPVLNHEGEEEEPAEEVDGVEEQGQGIDLEDPEEDADEHEQESDHSHHSDPEPEEATEEVVWKVYRYKQEGLGVPMADLLRATASRLGYAPSGPAYHCELWTHPWFEPHWEVTAILYESDPYYGLQEVSKHKDVAHRTTMEAGIAEAARRALYVLSHRDRAKLMDTRSKYTPYRASGEAKTFIAPAPAWEVTLNNLRELLAAVNTALDDTNNTLAKAQEKIFTLETQKRCLEALLMNKNLPTVRDDDDEPHLSPSPKRPRYDSPDARTEVLPWNRSS